MDFHGAYTGKVFGDTSTITSTMNRYGEADAAYNVEKAGFTVGSELSSMLAGASTRTICAWTKANAFDGGGPFTFGNSGPIPFGEKFAIITDGDGVIGKYRLNLGNNGGPVLQYTVEDPFGWHHLCGVYDGQEVSFYVDGLVRATRAIELKTTEHVGQVGVHKKKKYFNGAVNDLLVYSRALTSDEIAMLFGDKFVSRGTCDRAPTSAPTTRPPPTTPSPTRAPTNPKPTSSPPMVPTMKPTSSPTMGPTNPKPTSSPTMGPTMKPTSSPTMAPTQEIAYRQPLESSEEGFGHGVALSGTFTAVGASSSVLVYKCDPMPCDNVATLTPPVEEVPPGDETWTPFYGDDAYNGGFRVEISGNILVAVKEDPYHYYGTQRNQTVFVYKGVDDWMPVAEFKYPDAASNFGCSHAIDGMTIVVGANRDYPYDQNEGQESGAVFVYQSFDDGNSWDMMGKLLPEDVEPYNWFGTTVAVSGGTIAVSQIGSAEPGVYLYHETGSGWLQTAKITPPEFEWFGDAIFLSGTTLITGSYSGSAFIYENGTFVSKVTPDDGGNWGWGFSYGYNFALDNDILLVGEPHANYNSSYNDGTWNGTFNDGTVYSVGAVYIFRKNDTGYTQVAKIFADEPTQYDTFGASVALDGKLAIAGTGGTGPESIQHGNKATIFSIFS